MKVTLLHPATFALDGGAMFGIIPKPLWSQKIQPDEFNRITMALRVVLIQTDQKKILIDTGIGNYHPAKFQEQFAIKPNKQGLVSAIEEAGLNAEDITDIILTHLHFDHVGGLTDEPGKSLFPNAKLHIHKKHYEYALSPTLRDAGSFQDYYFKEIIEHALSENKVHFIEEEQGNLITDGKEKIDFKVSFGHTPYMMHPIFDQYIYMADLVPMSHHVHVPWVMGYDIEPGVTTVYKQRFYDFIIDQKLNLIFEHDRDIWGGPLEIDEKKKFKLSEAKKAETSLTQKLNY